MPKQIIIAEQHHIAAVFWEEQIQELVVATGTQQVSDIFLGLVENVIPGIDAAFVNIGDAERNGFIHVTDLGPLRLKKNAATITELLAPDQKALVQVMKEPTGNKGPRLTGNITLPGRYLVLMPHGKGVKLSRRVRDENERSRLRALAILVKPAGMGLLVRTEAEGKAEEAIMEDLELLQKQWESIQEQAAYSAPPALLNRDDDFIQRVLRDMYSADVNTIVTDSQAGMKRVKQHLSNWSGGRSPQGVFVDYHREPQPILEYFRVNAAIREALKPRVELPSGGYIIIEPTEALTVIDVNSGSFTRSATARETVLWTNREAATEIARQLRLRNIGGVIVVDFIDMDTNPDRLKLLEHFNNALRGDKARPQIAQLSELGLVELTRKRQGKNVYELFGQTCPTCGGLGNLVHLPGKSQGESLENPTIVPAAIASPAVTERFERERRIINTPAETDYERNPYQLDLANHPNYQEQGGAAPNSRRRRRRRNEISLKEDVNETEVTVIPSRDRDPERTSDRFPEERKTRIPSRAARREEVPQEKVVVEMTEFEQEIYALMGVSPLVRLDKEFKSPKSVLVYVTKPGETLELETETETAAETVEPEVSESKEPIIKPSAKIITQSSILDTLEAITEEPDIEPETIIETTVTDSVSETVEPTKETAEENQEETKEATIEETANPRRRRRRRSSAQKEVSV
ncbi:ribonuclease, Rne/Rng family [Xenococcus sp. PCC 7305]|uniref:Rne/Rng family ribonuclease n=1 Tax=Xenococcus sp. PCC 7305 TaxID=102125 RepID=UPI0002ABFB1E|nr:Rne/Rng family ribonuclease [Xenococcus sp. PCC 7305]ELS00991.1 ribonuclease, Rne/Rng family [Xenococcus sp. PCC 7305]